MPKPKSGESKDEFISRCMGYDDMQKYDQDQRAAICYSYWEEKNESTNISDIDIFIQRNRDRMDKDTLIGVLADKFNLDYEEARKEVMRKANMREKAKPIEIGYGQLVGIGRDSNGNKVAKFKTNTGKSFSIQTNNNLPSIHKETDLEDLDKNKVEKEVMNYVKKYGTKSQKEILPESVNENYGSDEEPYRDDAFISSNGWVYNVSVEGKHIGEFEDIDDAEDALKRWIKKNRFYPSIWFVDDHGGIEPYILEKKDKSQNNIIIEVQASFKVGNVLLEKGDRIRLVQEEKFRGDNGYRFQDEIAAQEIELFLENDADLYRQQFMPIIENIKRKMKSGRYDHSLAPKLWMYFVDNGIKKYIKEYGTPGDRIDSILVKKDRMTLAQKLADYYYDQIVEGEYGDI